MAPPRTGKTTILKQIANAVTTNHSDVHAGVVDRRAPRGGHRLSRSVDAEVIASSNDQDLETHVRLSRLVIDRCRRLVESGKDVFVLLDSITRVARAFNSVHGGSGRTMTGGVDARALEIPRKIFASARKTEESGSLTIIATALIDTGSRMDELIFQEFKGTGNMELVLDRKLAERRIYPAIDIPKSGTRKEEKLFPAQHLDAIHKLRRTMNPTTRWRRSSRPWPSCPTTSSSPRSSNPRPSAWPVILSAGFRFWQSRQQPHASLVRPHSFSL